MPKDNVATLARVGLVGIGLRRTPRRLRHFLRHYVELPLRYAGANDGALDALLEGATLPQTTLSFDVFDTAVTRAWFRPADIFLVTGVKLTAEALFEGRPEDWKKLRLRAEAAARTVKRDEIEFSMIYEWLARHLHWSEPEKKRAMQIELAIEAASIRPVARIKAAIDLARDRGSDVIFLSDTYLDQQFIQRQLERCGITCDQNRIYVSSVSGRTKGSGRLFQYVLAKRNIAADQMMHIGDNRHSDVDRATRIGAKACYFREQSPTRYERAYYRHRGSHLLRSATAGAARAARLATWHRDPRSRVLHEIASNVAGPMLTGYVLWVLLEARNRRLKRLYFVARDGQMLLLIAERLCRAFQIDIDCRYLLGSRRAFALPAAACADDVARLLIDDHRGKSLRTLLARVEITPEAHAHVLEQAGFSPTAWDTALASSDALRLDRLCRDDRFIAIVLDQAQHRRGVLLDYLRGVGLLDTVPAGLVDLGWRGRLQRWLCAVVRAGAGNPGFVLAGFYFGLRERFPPSQWGEQLVYEGPPYPAEVLLETFAAADHPSVAGFERRSDGSVGPVFAGPDEDHENARVIQESVTAFVDELVASTAQVGAAPEDIARFLHGAAKRAFARLEHAPTAAEAETIGAITFSGDHVHADPFPIAPRLTRAAVRKLFVSGYGRRLTHTQWSEGSIVRSLGPRERFIALRLWLAARRGAQALRFVVLRATNPS